MRYIRRLTGYSRPGAEKVTQHVYDAGELAKQRGKAPDAKESFESGREDDPAMPNIWPPDGVLPGFKEACLDFFWVRPFSLSSRRQRLNTCQICHTVELTILRALALGFHLPENYFLQYHTDVDNQLRLLHYPR